MQRGKVGQALDMIVSLFSDGDWFDVIPSMDDTVTYVTDLAELEVGSDLVRYLSSLLEILGISSERLYEMLES